MDICLNHPVKVNYNLLRNKGGSQPEHIIGKICQPLPENRTKRTYTHIYTQPRKHIVSPVYLCHKYYSRNNPGMGSCFRIYVNVFSIYALSLQFNESPTALVRNSLFSLSVSLSFRLLHTHTHTHTEMCTLCTYASAF